MRQQRKADELAGNAEQAKAWREQALATGRQKAKVGMGAAVWWEGRLVAVYCSPETVSSQGKPSGVDMCAPSTCIVSSMGGATRHS